MSSAEGYMPNIGEAWDRLQIFGDLMSSTRGLDLPSLESMLESDLKLVFNK